MNRIAVLTGLIVALISLGMLPERYATCRKPWIFFDLGNTVISSTPGQESHYIPGAHAYIRDLRRRGYPVGLITNVPEKWGPTRAQKIRELKRLVLETWTKDSSAEKMDWDDFLEPFIIIPARDADRKPAATLFRAAVARVAREEGTTECPVVFQGEDPHEVESAIRNGLKGYIALKDPIAPFLPIAELERL